MNCTTGIRLTRLVSYLLLAISLWSLSWPCSASKVLSHLKLPVYRTRRDAENPGGSRENLKGRPGQGYYVAIELGTPPQKINVLVDSGSSNFAVATSLHPYITSIFQPEKSTTYTLFNKPVSVPYTQGSWEGKLGSDFIHFDGSPLDRVRVQVATIEQSSNFFINGSNWQGILGLGYVRLSKPDSSVIPVFDEFVINGMSTDRFSMQLCSSSAMDDVSEPSVAGTMVFGELDDSLYQGELLYTPIVRKWYYEVIITDIQVDGVSLGLNCKRYNFDKTIVDSGTTNFRVTEDVFDAIVQHLKKHDKIDIPEEFWVGRQMMCWNFDHTPWDLFPDITISLLSSLSSTKEFTLRIPPQLYLRETVEHSPFSGQHCYKFAVTKSDRGTVIGAVIMEGFYVVFDRENVQVGFAATTCGAEGRMNPRSEVRGPFNRVNAVDCAYVETEQADETLLMVAYVMAAICALSLVPVFVVLIQAGFRRSRDIS